MNTSLFAAIPGMNDAFRPGTPETISVDLSEEEKENLRSHKEPENLGLSEPDEEHSEPEKLDPYDPDEEATPNNVGDVIEYASYPPKHIMHIGEEAFRIEEIYNPDEPDEEALEDYVEALNEALPENEIDFNTENVQAVMQRLRGGQSPEEIREAAENGADGLEDLNDAELTILLQHGDMSTAEMSSQEYMEKNDPEFKELGSYDVENDINKDSPQNNIQAPGDPGMMPV